MNVDEAVSQTYDELIWSVERGGVDRGLEMSPAEIRTYIETLLGPGLSKPKLLRQVARVCFEVGDLLNDCIGPGDLRRCTGPGDVDRWYEHYRQNLVLIARFNAVWREVEAEAGPKGGIDPRYREIVHDSLRAELAWATRLWKRTKKRMG